MPGLVPGRVRARRLDETDCLSYNAFVVPSADTRTFLQRLEQAIADGRLQFTWKADDEIADLGWSRQDALDQLAVLEPAHLLRTEPAKGASFTLVWVFCPTAWELDRHLWIRLTETEDHPILVSFHLAEGDPWT